MIEKNLSGVVNTDLKFSDKIKKIFDLLHFNNLSSCEQLEGYLLRYNKRLEKIKLKLDDSEKSLHPSLNIKILNFRFESIKKRYHKKVNKLKSNYKKELKENIEQLDSEYRKKISSIVDNIKI